MIEFKTEYKTTYTVPIKSVVKNKFASKYSQKSANTVISINNRPQGMKFTSRVVSKG